MAEELCPISDLPRYSCAHCTGAGAEPPEPGWPPGTVITARHPGRCGICDDPIAPGQRIRADPDGGGWVHDHHDPG